MTNTINKQYYKTLFVTQIQIFISFEEAWLLLFYYRRLFTNSNCQILTNYYSYLSAFTGFLLATIQVWELTVNKATTKAISGPAINAHTGIGV
jgi:hypothetical protein